MKRLFLLLILIFSSTTLADQEGPCSYDDSTAPMDIAQYQQMMTNLWINDSPRNRRGDLLDFSFDEINVNDGVVSFSSPRLNNMPIEFFQIVCAQTEKNFLGFDRCLSQGIEYSAEQLCRNLGFAGYVSSRPSYVSSMSTPSTYHPYFNRNDTWDSLATSILAGPYNIQVIGDFSCRTDIAPR